MTKFIVVSRLMRAVLRKLESVAAFEGLPIHIGGESGTGKESARAGCTKGLQRIAPPGQ